MKTVCALFFGAAIFAATSTDLAARTWTDVASGRTLEGDYVESNETQVVIKSGNRTLKINIARLGDADKAFIKEQSAKPVGGGDAGGAKLAQLTPPASVKTSPITGTAKARKSSIEFTNKGDKKVTKFVLNMLFLKADGSVGKSVPHTHGAGEVRKGKSETVKVSSFFMEDDTTALGAQVIKITYEDDSTWPSAPATPPARNGKDPVAAIVVGVIGEGDRAKPVTALHNYDKKDIKKVYYRIEYLDDSGEVLDKTSYGYSGGDDPILPSGKSIVIPGGDGPPEGATDAKAMMTRITFADGSKWKAPK